MNEPEAAQPFLLCERAWLYHVMIFVAGYFGAFTYLLRGNVFCNAQTGNVVLMGLALGQGEVRQALYYLIPISAYIAGAFLSELLPNPVKRHLPLRWDTLFIAIEMAVVLVLGFMPDSAPVQISQVAVNFVASMQYNTFRQAEGIPMATTFATNHIRQIGVGLAREVHGLRTGTAPDRRRLRAHFEMLVFFFLGATVGTALCARWGGKAIWCTLVPLLAVFIALCRADLTLEQDRKEEKPHGH